MREGTNATLVCLKSQKPLRSISTAAAFGFQGHPFELLSVSGWHHDVLELSVLKGVYIVGTAGGSHCRPLNSCSDSLIARVAH